jgi:hypothetical protein
MRRVPAEYFEQIGRIAVLWNGVESLLPLLLSEILCLDGWDASIILDKLFQSSRKIDLLKDIGEREAHSDSEFRNIVIEAESVRRERNDIVHSMWIQVETEADQEFVRIVRGLNVSPGDVLFFRGTKKAKPYTLAEISDFATRVDLLEQRIVDFIRAYRLRARGESSP